MKIFIKNHFFISMITEFDPEYKIPWFDSIPQQQITPTIEEINEFNADPFNLFSFGPPSDDDEFNIAFNFDPNQNIDISGLEFPSSLFELPIEPENNLKIAQKEVPVEGSTPRISTRGFKRRIDLSGPSKSFKNFFYKIFTTKAKFPKQLVCKIHNKVCKSLNLPKISREESRSIDLYFQNYSKDSERILIYLHQHKEELLELIPELLNLK